MSLKGKKMFLPQEILIHSSGKEEDVFLWPKRTHNAATCYCQPPQQQHPAAPGRAHPPRRYLQPKKGGASGTRSSQAGD